MTILTLCNGGHVATDACEKKWLFCSYTENPWVCDSLQIWFCTFSTVELMSCPHSLAPWGTTKPPSWTGRDWGREWDHMSGINITALFEDPSWSRSMEISYFGARNLCYFQSWKSGGGGWRKQKYPAQKIVCTDWTLRLGEGLEARCWIALEAPLVSERYEGIEAERKASHSFPVSVSISPERLLYIFEHYAATSCAYCINILTLSRLALACLMVIIIPSPSNSESNISVTMISALSFMSEPARMHGVQPMSPCNSS